MRKIVTLVSIGITGWVLAGCEQQQDTLEPATGLPENESPSGDTDIQIGQGEPAEPETEPGAASPPIEREIEPNVIRPDEEQGGGSELEPQSEPQGPEPQSPQPQN